MPIEIEHKYLVNNCGYKADVTERTLIRQGYLSKEKERTVRIRVRGAKGYVTIKGENHGAERLEFEYQIPVEEANMILDELCIKPLIVKYRNIVVFENNRWEIDEFQDELDGLVLAEIEIPFPDYKYNLPPYIGKEVTNDIRYYNSSLLDRIPEKG